MEKIIFVTSNQGKVESLRSRLPREKYEIENINIDISEIQAHSAEEISKEKAIAAYKILNKKLIVQDSSFHIHALNNFPGVYIKYINETIGIKGLLKLMEGVEDRSCYFEGALTYIDNNEIKTFVHRSMIGLLSNEIRGKNIHKAWSPLWQVFIEPNSNKTLAELKSEEQNRSIILSKSNNEFTQFVDWILK